MSHSEGSASVDLKVSSSCSAVLQNGSVALATGRPVLMPGWVLELMFITPSKINDAVPIQRTVGCQVFVLNTEAACQRLPGLTA